jgi:quercetin dioxygenase-like cupin family protein
MSFLTTAQVAVRNEPRHHLVFENEYIRILDVHLPPGDTTEYHIHNTPSVFTTFTKTITGSQLIGGQPVKSISIAGEIWYDSLSTTRIHRVWNEDSTWFHVMDIELTASKSHGNPPVLQQPSLELLFNQPLANGYKLNLPSGGQINISSSPTGYLLLSLADIRVEYKTNQSFQKRIMKAGHYIWIEAGQSSSITAMNHSSSFFLLQVK